ncbi:hypothetical protein APUTEX25_003752, partial [Auxenochlorella protothecoides]
HKGFSRVGSIRTSTLHIVGLSVSAIRVSNHEILSDRSTEILACTADSNGNIGTGNKGKNNFGTKNVGNSNIGEHGLACAFASKMCRATAIFTETDSKVNWCCPLAGNSNVGAANWGNNNKGTGNRCFNKTGDRKILNDCSLQEICNYAWVLSFLPPPAKNVPKYGLVDMTCVVTTPGYIPNYLTCNLYTYLPALLFATTYPSPSSSVTPIESKSLSVKIMKEYPLGSALVYTQGSTLKEVVPLVLLNPSPPPPGAAPPPPRFGAVSGTVSRTGSNFAFSLTITSFSPNIIYFALFTTDDAIIQNDFTYKRVPPYKATMTLDASSAALASYAQVVAVKIGQGSTSALTVRW